MNKSRTVAAVATIVFGLLIGTVTATAQSRPTDWNSVKGGAAARRTAHPKLRSSNLGGGSTTRLSPDSAPDSNGRVLVQVDGEDVAAVQDAVTDAGGEVLTSGLASVQANVPQTNLGALADDGRVALVGPPRRLRADATSQGVGTTNASAWQTAGQNGAAVKVAIVDVGFSGLTAAENSNALPPDVQITKINHCGPGTTGFDGSGPNGTLPPITHGVATSEIVHQMAPGAALTLICVFSDGDFALAEQDIANAGIKIVSASIGSPLSGRGDGNDPSPSPAAAVRAGRLAGQLWSVSAGNEADRHHQFVGADRDGDTALETLPGNPSPGPDGAEVYSFHLNAGQFADIGMKWDAWPVTNQEFYFCIWRDAIIGDPTEGCTGNNQSQVFQAPIAVGSFPNTTGAGHTYFLAVFNFNGSLGLRFDMYFGGQESSLASVTAAGSIIEPATSKYVMTAGAHFWQDNTLEPFSSQGPTIDGRVKPDISGPDGVANDVFGSFFGTSTSAPHAAGAAALLLGANPLLDPAQLQSILQSKAIDAGAAGDDNQFGWGRLNLGTAPPPPPASPTGDLFFGLAPTRTYDTRAGSAFLPVSNGDQPYGPDFTATVPLVGQGGVPVGATSVVFNLTATQPTAGGFLTVFPSNAARPLVASVDFIAGQTATINTTAKVGPDGAVKIFNHGGNTHVTIDIVGYYAPSGVGGSALNTAAPVRVVDTRPNSPSPAPPVSNGDQPLANGQTFVQPFRSQTFNDPLGGGNSITIPVDATAVVLNVTITGPVSGGFVSVFPEGSPPVVSDVNFAANQTVSNLVIAKIGADGSVRFFHHGNGSHLVVDIAGWFGATGSRYVALPAPTREFDTRTGNERLGQMSLNQTLNLRERLVNGVPHDATAILAVFTSLNSTGGYLNVFPSGAPTPFAAAFSFSPGQLVDNTVISGVGGNGNVSIFTHSNGTDVVSDLLGYFVP